MTSSQGLTASTEGKAPFILNYLPGRVTLRGPVG